MGVHFVIPANLSIMIKKLKLNYWNIGWKNLENSGTLTKNSITMKWIERINYKNFSNIDKKFQNVGNETDSRKYRISSNVYRKFQNIERWKKNFKNFSNIDKNFQNRTENSRTLENNYMKILVP